MRLKTFWCLAVHRLPTSHQVNLCFLFSSNLFFNTFIFHVGEPFPLSAWFSSCVPVWRKTSLYRDAQLKAIGTERKKKCRYTRTPGVERVHTVLGLSLASGVHCTTSSGEGTKVNRRDGNYTIVEVRQRCEDRIVAVNWLQFEFSIFLNNGNKNAHQFSQK